MTDEPFFKATIAGREYELAKLTLGDMRTIKRHFGVVELDNLNPSDPDFICGCLYLCLLHDGMSHEDAVREVEDVELKDVLGAEDESETPEGDPTVAAPSSANGKGGTRATPQKTRGKQPSRSS